MEHIDYRTIKRSTERLYINGSMYEHVQYANPYFFNFPPRQRSASSAAAASSMPSEGPERRADNLASARSSLRRLIEANSNAWPERCKFITYTFAENVKDYEVAMHEWRNFSRRLTERFGRQKYIAVVEFQPSGRVHYHVLHFTIPYVVGLKHHIAKLWGQGFIKIKVLTKIRSVATYVSKYLRKSTVDSRLSKKKAYFTTRGLVLPYVVRDEKLIAEFFGSGSMTEESNQVFLSPRFGTINYSRGRIITQ